MADPGPNHGALTRIPNIDQLIVDAVGQGKSLKSIAEQYGVSDVAILHRVKDHPDYRANLEIGLELRMDRREAELEHADTNVAVTRSDRLLGHARWLAERCAPARFGAGQKIMGADGGTLTVEIVKYGRTIEPE